MPETIVTLQKSKPHSTVSIAAVTGILNVLAVAVERFGWPGAVMCFGAYFVVQYSTIEQKHRLIDLYLLGQQTPYALIALCILFFLVLVAQQTLNRRKIAVLEQRNAIVERETDSLATQLQDAQSRLALMEAKRSATRNRLN